MRRTIILLALSLWIAALVVSCGGTVSSDNLNAQTPARPQTTTAPSSTSPVPVASANSTADVKSQSAPCTEAKKPVITKPVEGGKVILVDTISGTTPCPGMNHYVLVIPTENAVTWVQNKPFQFVGKDSFTSQAQFGEGNNGIGKQFLVRILVINKDLNKELPPGQLDQIPADGVLSDAITVTREK